MIVLGIDTSCDDTSMSIIKDRKVLSTNIFSQIVHSKYGGVVPELASRDHIKNIVPVMRKTLDDAKMELKQLDGIGVTYGPGLVGSLLIGLCFTKSLSYSRRIPFIGINHIEGHVFSLFIEKEIETPFIVLIVSGGHTELILIKEPGSYEILGSTLDDAAGEAFDKVAGLLGLPYPGGPEIEELSKTGNRDAINFPRANVPGYDFSFSGLKTAVLYYLKDHRPQTIDHRQDIAASFQEAVCDSLIEKVVKASEDKEIPRIGIAGGVSANERLREKLKEIGEKKEIDVSFPEKEFCTDNGAMIALCASYYLERGISSPYDLKAESQARLGC